MKKQYIKPKIEVHILETESGLANSSQPVNCEESDITYEIKEEKLNFSWED